MKYIIFFIAVILAVFCRVFLVSVYKVSSQSMAPAILAGDFILSLNTAYGFKNLWSNEVYFEVKPKQGELIAFHKQSKIYIKRVLAVGPNEIEFRNGEYFINSMKCDYIFKEDTEIDFYGFFEEKCSSNSYKIIKLIDGNKTASTSKLLSKLKLEDRQIFVAADHRNFKTDPDVAEIISVDQIIGKPIFIWMSYSSTQDFISKTLGLRWNRILTKLN